MERATALRRAPITLVAGFMAMAGCAESEFATSGQGLVAPVGPSLSQSLPAPGDTAVWIDNVVEFMDDEDQVWRLERTYLDADLVTVGVYIDDAYSHSVTLTLAHDELQHLTITLPDDEWVSVGSDGKVSDSSFDFLLDDECEPGDPPGGDPLALMVEEEDPRCDGEINALNGSLEDPCQDELDRANAAVGEAALMFFYGLGVTVASGGVFAVPAQFGTGFMGVRAAWRVGQLVHCRLNNPPQVAGGYLLTPHQMAQLLAPATPVRTYSQTTNIC
jgi:hypothetical protein